MLLNIYLEGKEYFKGETMKYNERRLLVVIIILLIIITIFLHNLGALSVFK